MRKNKAVQILAVTSIFGLAVLLGGCGSSGSSSAVVQANASGLAISPNSASVNESGTLQLTATGGNPPYSFSVISPAYPAGGSINASTGFYYAPSTSETVQIQVSDASGNIAYASVVVGSGSGTSSEVEVCNSMSNCESVLGLTAPLDGGNYVQYATYNAEVACQYLGYSRAVSFQVSSQYINCGNMYTVAEGNGTSFTYDNVPICYHNDPYATVTGISEIECSN